MARIVKHASKQSIKLATKPLNLTLGSASFYFALEIATPPSGARNDVINGPSPMLGINSATKQSQLPTNLSRTTNNKKINNCSLLFYEGSRLKATSPKPHLTDAKGKVVQLSYALSRDKLTISLPSLKGLRYPLTLDPSNLSKLKVIFSDKDSGNIVDEGRAK